MAEYRDRFSELTALGLGLVAVSVDGTERSRALIEQISLPFPLLSDQSREVVRAYGILNENMNGGIAYPSTFVLDKGRTVRFRSLDRTARRVDLDGLFAFLRAGMSTSVPAAPARSGVVPTLRDLNRVVRNALRYGVRSPWR